MINYQRLSLTLILLFIAILVLLSPEPAEAGDAPVASGNRGYYAVKNSKVELTAETANIKVVEDTAFVTCRLTLVNHGPAQTIEFGFPEITRSETVRLHNFTTFKNGAPLPVRKHRSLPARVPGISDAYYTAWYTSKVFLAPGEKCEISHIYQAEVPPDDIGGRLISYSLLTSALWQGPVKTATITVDVEGYKPYYNLLLPKELGYVPLMLTPEGRFTFSAQKIKPEHDLFFYYQPRGPELTLYRLQMDAEGGQVTELIGQKKYGEALARLKALSPQLLAQNKLAEDDLHLVMADLYLKTNDGKSAAGELSAVRNHDAVWAYYHILASLENKRQDLAGQTYRSLDELNEPGFTKAGFSLLKKWAQSQIKEFLAEPTAPVPQSSASHHNRARLLIITIGLLSLASVLLTLFRIRKKKVD